MSLAFALRAAAAPAIMAFISVNFAPCLDLGYCMLSHEYRVSHSGVVSLAFSLLRHHLFTYVCNSAAFEPYVH
eukprot:scaffold223168_cov34-Prasinocladus_malaysianus.AAC.1